MITVAVVLLTTKKGEHIINLRLTKDRKPKYISFSTKLQPHQFKKDALQNWVIKHPDAVFINQRIEEKRKRAVALITAAEIGQKELSLEDLIERIETKGEVNGTSFLQAIQDKAKYHLNVDEVNAYYKYNGLAQRVEEIWKRDYSPQQINNEIVEQFIKARKQKGTHNNTIRKDLSHMATVWDRVAKGDNPFREKKSKIKKIPSKKTKLTKDDIGAIEKVKGVPALELVRDLFLFSFYAHGMRFENVVSLTKEKVQTEYIGYQMNKGQKHREIAYHPRLTTLVEKYFNTRGELLFPVLKNLPETEMQRRDIIGSANAKVNETLKVVGQAAGIATPLTFHMARHTFAHMAKKNGSSPFAIQHALGHSSIRTTEIYLGSLDDDEINAAVKGVYE